MNKKFYVTTPIYYVNAEPHLGHAYTTILADFMSRFHKMLGYDSYFLTGTDEHGDKISEAAEAMKTTPQEYADKISNKFRSTWDSLDIKYDDFIRTTDERHKKVVRQILQKVYDKGDIYFGSYGGNYCVGCERFLTDKELVDGKCPEHDKVPDYIEEKNYFFKMSKYQDWLIEHIEKNPDFIRPQRYRNEVLSMLKGDVLEDLCISRPASRLDWGIELPFDSNYVTYVWFDALINYISALDFPDGDKYKECWPAVNHIIAKDILKPHGIFWPTMLKSADIEPYQSLNIHGYWNMDDAKMSKSLGNVVTPHELVDKYGNDQIRYFFLKEMTFGSDAKFNEDVVIDRINFDLANDLGNLINRTFNMVNKYCDGNIPERADGEIAGTAKLMESLKSATDDYLSYSQKFQTSIGIEKLWEFIRSLNKYVDEYKPWELAKNNDSDVLAAVLRNLLESIYSVAKLLDPVLISTSPKIIDSLNLDEKERNIDQVVSLNNLTVGKKLKDLPILFPKLEKKKEEKPVKAKSKKSSESGENLIEFDEFMKVDIRVAEILEAEKVEGSDKLLYLKVNSGFDERNIVAGIAAAYEPDDIIGKKILLVANLKPATIFGKESNGMLLAAKKGKKGPLNVIFINDEIPTGAKLG